MRDFHNLKVWEKAHVFTLAIYRATITFPPDEMYGLTSQLRRAGASVSANIAEGCGRGGQTEFRRFLTIALGSASEVEYHLLLAHDLDYLTDETYEPLHEEATQVKRMLTALIQRLRADS